MRQFKGPFTPNHFDSVKMDPGAFAWLVRTKQPDRDLVKWRVSVRFQAHSGAVCLWRESKRTSHRISRYVILA